MRQPDHRLIHADPPDKVAGFPFNPALPPLMLANPAVGITDRQGSDPLLFLRRIGRPITHPLPCRQRLDIDQSAVQADARLQRRRVGSHAEHRQSAADRIARRLRIMHSRIGITAVHPAKRRIQSTDNVLEPSRLIVRHPIIRIIRAGKVRENTFHQGAIFLQQR